MLTNVTSALIAGGKSKRFGSPKELAGYDGRRLIDYALEIAKSISEKTIIIGPSALKITNSKIPRYDDLIPDCGPLGGIYTALHYAKDKYVAVLPVDMPLLNLKIYRALYPSLKDKRPVVACSHKGIEPLVSIWPVETLAALKSQIEKKDYRLYYLLKKLQAVEINFASLPDYKHHWFENINYKKDINLLEKDASLKGNKNSVTVK
jgi:molybdenum cofactor guanylyltransferase